MLVVILLLFHMDGCHKFFISINFVKVAHPGWDVLNKRSTKTYDEA